MHLHNPMNTMRFSLHNTRIYCGLNGGYDVRAA